MTHRGWLVSDLTRRFRQHPQPPLMHQLLILLLCELADRNGRRGLLHDPFSIRHCAILLNGHRGSRSPLGSHGFCSCLCLRRRWCRLRRSRGSSLSWCRRWRWVFRRNVLLVIGLSRGHCRRSCGWRSLQRWTSLLSQRFCNRGIFRSNNF